MASNERKKLIEQYKLADVPPPVGCVTGEWVINKYRVPRAARVQVVYEGMVYDITSDQYNRYRWHRRGEGYADIVAYRAVKEAPQVAVPAGKYKYMPGTTVYVRDNRLVSLSDVAECMYGNPVSTGCCGMRYVSSQRGAIKHEDMHPDVLRDVVGKFIDAMCAGSGCAIMVFNSNDRNTAMNFRNMYDALMADPLHRAVAHPPVRNTVHDSLLYPVMLYPTANLPDSGGTTKWGVHNVQIPAPRLSKTGANEYAKG